MLVVGWGMTVLYYRIKVESKAMKYDAVER